MTSLNRNIPTFQLTAMTFSIAFLVGVITFVKNGCRFAQLRQPLGTWVNGVVGLCGYHLCYFTAIKSAPPIEASLIAYLWPILIVVFASFLPGERLRWFHIGGVLLGFSGVALLIMQNGALTFSWQYLLGYSMALLCAVIWAAYSVISRRFSAVPTVLIGAYCGITALVSLLLHLLFEQTVRPVGLEWLAILLLGLGPVGCAFFIWDIGMKNGNIKLLGTLSYAAPLLSSALLICFGQARFSLWIILVCLLIVGGAALTAWGSWREAQRGVSATKNGTTP